MFDILFARTFYIVGTMLLITALASYMNKKDHTKKTGWSIIIIVFGLLFAITMFSNLFPINLILV
jgi:uncharacterized membrane protein